MILFPINYEKPHKFALQNIKPACGVFEEFPAFAKYMFALPAISTSKLVVQYVVYVIFLLSL